MTSKHKILVTGATGTQGGGVVRYCLEAGHTVHALVRDPDAPAALQLTELGAICAKGDFDNVESIAAATRGMTAVFLNTRPTFEDYRIEVQRARNVLKAAKSSGVKTFIYSSTVQTGQHESFPGWSVDHPFYHYWIGKAEIEKLVKASDFEWMIFRPAFFMQNLHAPSSHWQWPDLARNVVRSPYRAHQSIDIIDGAGVGAFVNAALSKPEDFWKQETELAVENLTVEDMIASLSKARGQKILIETVSKEEVEKSDNLVLKGHLIFAEGNHQVDIVALEKIGVKTKSLDEYLAGVESW